ncbi:hypothetical protein [Planctomonas psychrotolerans]|uniref:hypothetical protein n=1 Tax=Planctomonas psychrotolerans TaxID=2528712 RepID=UPI00123A415F|nr:hypothetical protein [Planctomonas psychrotolerans]
MVEGGDRRAPGTRRRLAVAAIALALTLPPAGVAAAATPEPTPADRVAAAPTLDVPPPETVKDGRLEFTGTKAAGTDVQIIVRDDATPYCQTGAPQRRAMQWACTAVSLPSGQAVPVVARTSGTSASSASSEARTVDVLNPPTVRAAPSGVVSGTSHPGATVTVTSTTGSRCAVIPFTETTWSCVLNPVPASGPDEVRATQETEWSDGPSLAASVSVVIDSTPPAAPTISTPRPDARVPLTGTTYSGSGESGATVDVYQSVVPVCSALVRNGAWSCDGAGLKPGANRITALQRDAAGNVGPWAEVTVDAFQPTAAPTPVPSAPAEAGAPPGPTATEGPSPGSVPDPDTTTPARPAEPAEPRNSPSTEAPTEPEDAAAAPPSAGPPSSGIPGVPPGSTTGWSAPSVYGSALAPLPTAFVDLRWLTSLGVALGILLLIVMPAILLRSALGDRVSARRARVTGRNRASTDAADGPVNRWVVAGVCLIGAAGLVAVSLRVEAQENFLRLLLATTLGLAVVNGVGVVAMAHGFRRFRGTVVHVRIAPAMLLLTAAAALLSRVAGLVPPLIVGQMLGLRYAEEQESERTRVALVSAGTLTVLSVASWGLYSASRAGSGFWTAFSGELLSTITLAGLASAVVALLPLGRPLGRSLARGINPARLVGSVVVLTIGSAALASATGAEGAATIVPLTVSAVGFAAVCVSVWVWMRYVEPHRQ